jgi:DNA repair protein RadA/Sms
MSKVKSAFFCQECGYEAAKWLGKCPSCNSWNSFIEEKITATKSSTVAFSKSKSTKNEPRLMQDISMADQMRLDSSDVELNRVLGGGIVPGSLMLFGGEPGIGKSTLLLQFAVNSPRKILYISGEESEQQIKMRAERITSTGDTCYILTETKTQNIFRQILEIEPDIVIIDSIQTLHTDYIESSAGSISQIRECTAELIKYAKESNVPVLLIGHITKDGTIAGPKILEHMVDTVLQFEGDRNHVYRILRSLKNRFGSTAELGIYEMQGSGLREVDNPSEILISHKDEQLSGTAIATTLEGMRPLMIEIQEIGRASCRERV